MPAILKSLDKSDKISDQKSRLNQLIDIISSDINSTTNRRTYSSFITGLTTPVSSSLFNTIYDQDHTLQSSNALFDITFGVYAYTKTENDNTLSIDGSSIVTSLTNKQIDSSGKYIFDATTSCMMREKINIYRQYAQSLLGNANNFFTTPHNADLTDSNILAAAQIKEALFINIKRLFKRDNISKGTFGMKFFNRTGNVTLVLPETSTGAANGNIFTSAGTATTGTSLAGRSGLTAAQTGTSAYSSTSQVTLLDANASTTYSVHPVSGEYSTIKLFIDNKDPIDCGLIFYDAGVIVLDVNKIFNLDDTVQGVISFPDTSDKSAVYFDIAGTNRVTYTLSEGKKALNYYNALTGGTLSPATLKNFLQLATIDEIIKHFCVARFVSSSNTSLTFQNETIINSTIFFCRAAPSEFNYSTNPSYINENGKILIVDDVTDQPFSYITTVGLYDNLNNLLAVAKLSRPIEKNPNNELTIRVRLDY